MTRETVDVETPANMATSFIEDNCKSFDMKSIAQKISLHSKEVKFKDKANKEIYNYTKQRHRIIIWC